MSVHYGCLLNCYAVLVNISTLYTRSLVFAFFYLLLKVCVFSNNILFHLININISTTCFLKSTKKKLYGLFSICIMQIMFLSYIVHVYGVPCENKPLSKFMYLG